MSQHSCLYEGWVRHQRLVNDQAGTPEHSFKYAIAFLYLDLSEADDLFRSRWLWSTRGFAPVWFRRADHHGPSDQPLSDSIRELVQDRLGDRPMGPIRLLTHPRYFGFCMNPVSFYFCFPPEGSEPLAIVAEVNNTPWGEQHCYVIDYHAVREDHAAETTRKNFHVSPFMPMDMSYRWALDTPRESLAIGIQNHQGTARRLNVQMRLERQPLTTRSLARHVLRYPLLTQKVFLAIYWQALRLWWKGCHFYPHPSSAHQRTSPPRAADTHRVT